MSHSSVVGSLPMHKGSALDRIDNVDTEDGSEKPLVTSSAPVRHPERTRHSSSFLSILAWWLPELVAALLSLASLIVVVIILRIYDGVAIAEMHLPRSLTLNGIIAAVATVNRACLTIPVSSAIMQEIWLYYAVEAGRWYGERSIVEMNTFDAASRGAWGSMRLLLHLKGRRMFASLGALIIIISLAFGTFTQQLIAYDTSVPTQPGSSSSPGNIPWTSRWWTYTGSLTAGPTGVAPETDILASIYAGILGGGAAPLTIPCATGNCTWPTTPSLAVCGGCQDTDWNTTAFNVTVTSITNITTESGYCNYTLASGNVARYPAPCNTADPRNGDLPAFFWSLTNATESWVRSTDGIVKLVEFDLFGHSFIANSQEYYSNDSTLVAKTCALWWCVQEFTTTTASSQQSQRIDVVSSHTNFTFDAESFNVNVEAVFESIPSTSADGSEWGLFGVDLRMVQVYNMYLREALYGTTALIPQAAFSSDLMQGIWNGTQDADAWIGNVATSMTNAIRTRKMAPDWPLPQYDGVSYQLGVRVRWEWLILPVILVLASVLMLAVVMVRTAYSPVAAWKGSPLAFLLFDVDQELKDAAFGHEQEYHGIERAIKKSNVRLRKVDGGLWRFEQE